MGTISSYTPATEVTDDDVLLGNDGTTTKTFTGAIIKTYVGWSYRDVAYPGVLSTSTGTMRLAFPVATTVVGVSLRCTTAPAGAAILVDVNKNGTTIFTTQGNRPTVAAGAFASAAEVTNMDVTAFAAGDYMTVDVDQIGSSTPGSDLVVTVRYR